MKNQEEALCETLSDSLTRVIDLVKFAEAKNAALLAFSSAMTVAIANLLTRSEPPPSGYGRLLPIAAVLFIASAVIALVSLLPRINLSRFFKAGRRNFRSANLLFYGDVAQLDIDEIADKMKERYRPAKGTAASQNLLDDLCIQIHVNSGIARRKYRLFAIGAWIALAGFALLLIPPLAAVVCAAAHAAGAVL
jgi:hypothetical protein